VALYIPQSRRRRNAALLAVVALLIGLSAGFLLGRTSATTAEESAAAAHARADTLATRVEALTIEYDQAVAGTGDTIQAGVIDALDGIDRDLDRLIAVAPWLGAAQIAALHDATASVRTDATSKVDPKAFSTTTSDAAKTIRTTFGVDT
jgi:hypothetical protein